MSRTVAPDLAAAVDRDGYAIVPDVLTTREVDALRGTLDDVLDARGIAKAGGTVLPNAAVAAPEIGAILTHDGILAAVRSALGCDAPLFTLEADLHRNYIARSWHKDTGEQVMDDGYFGVHSFDRDDCRVVKVAVYLQDHGDGRGLRVRPGSHRSSAIGAGDGVEIASRAGDIVLFDVRISHRGVRPSVLDVVATGIGRTLSHNRPTREIAAWRRRLGEWTGQPDRMALYFAFGLDNEWSETFAARNMRRQLKQLGRTTVELPPSLVEAFATSGVRTAGMPAC